ncbi:MAG: hypothetical protein IH571_05060, partial [Acholeplasmataceae bacterium]|nr:hypothetical protein [Acholeplasmataceae bacterium]
MKKTNKKAIIIYISIILFVFNMSISFAFWASQVNIGSNISTGSITVGSWPFIPNGFLGVSQNGDEGDNYITLDEVQATGNYILMSHIDWNQNTFQSIGGNDVFSGVFIGNGYAISNIMITNSTSPYVGLFARNNGTISNLSLTNITIDLTTNQDVYVGGIAGINTGTIEQSFSTGSIIVSSSKTTSSNNQTLVNNLYVGGVSGSNTGSIVDSYANINLTAITSILAGNPRSNVTANTYAGGLVGLNSTAGIERSYALGVVNATSTATRTQGNSTTYAYVYAGGLIGDNTHA